MVVSYPVSYPFCFPKIIFRIPKMTRQKTLCNRHLEWGQSGQLGDSNMLNIEQRRNRAIGVVGGVLFMAVGMLRR